MNEDIKINRSKEKSNASGHIASKSDSDQNNPFHSNVFHQDPFHDSDLQSSISGSAGYIISDDSVPMPGQLTKDAFLVLLESSVRDELKTLFKGTRFSEADCPWLPHWFNYYHENSAEHLEDAILKYEPSAAGATNAYDLIYAVLSRVKQGVSSWLETGKITDIPEGIPAELAPADVENMDLHEIKGKLGEGATLPTSTQSKMQSAYGNDLPDVKIHDGSDAAQLASKHNSKAFMAGNDMVFGAGEYKPDSAKGDLLIAHEMAHAIQQKDAGGKEAKGNANQNALEAEAEQSTKGALGSMWDGLKGFSEKVIPRMKTGISIQSCKPDLEVERIADPLSETEINDSQKKEKIDIQEDSTKWEYWTVDQIISLKSGEIAEQIKADTKNRAKDDPTNGSPNNPNRWVRLYPREVEDAIKYLNNKDSKTIEWVQKGDKIKIPTAKFWDGLELAYYSDDSFALGGKMRRERIKMSPLVEAGELMEQEMTLSEAKNKKKKLKPKELVMTRGVTDVFTVMELEDPELASWIYWNLGPYQNQIEESANANQIPKQLLATVLIAELSDISVVDVNQTEGSIGMAQIQIQTAVDDNLIDFSEKELNKEKKELKKIYPDLNDNELTEKAKFELAKEMLWIPQYAIEAAAKEIAILINKMGKNTDKPWQKKFGFTASGVMGNEIYNYVSSDLQIDDEQGNRVKGIGDAADREANVANMVTAAYNSPGIITASQSSIDGMSNATTHGGNAAGIAVTLYMWGMFR